VKFSLFIWVSIEKKKSGLLPGLLIEFIKVLQGFRQAMATTKDFPFVIFQEGFFLLRFHFDDFQLVVFFDDVILHNRYFLKEKTEKKESALSWWRGGRKQGF
jgi:hypothetical protein